MSVGPTVFTLLHEVRKRPEMYLGALDAGDPWERLCWLLVGYQAALDTHGIEETPQSFLRGFSAFVREETGWPTANQGALAAISERYATIDERLAALWRLASEYERALGIQRG